MGLVERILTDVSDKPGNPPLLEFALTALWDLWEQQVSSELSHSAYEAIGRVEGALSRHADKVYERLSPAEQKQARRVFVGWFPTL